MILIKSKAHSTFCEIVKIINNINNRNKYLFQKIHSRAHHFSFYNEHSQNQEDKNEGKKCVRHFLRFHKELKYLVNKELSNDSYIDNEPFSRNIPNLGTAQLANENNKKCDIASKTNQIKIESQTETNCSYQSCKEIVNKHVEKNVGLIYKTFEELSLKDIYYLYEKISNKDLFILFVIKLLNNDDTKENKRSVTKNNFNIGRKVNTQNKLNIDNLLYPFFICSDFYIRKGNILIYKNIDFFNDVQIVCKNLIVHLFDKINKNNSQLKFKELNQVFIISMKLERNDPNLFSTNNINELARMLSFRFFQINQKEEDNKRVKDVRSFTDLSINMGDVSKLLYELIIDNKEIAKINKNHDMLENIQNEEHINLIKNILTHSVRELKNQNIVKDIFFAKNIISILYSLTHISNKSFHNIFVEIFENSLNFFYSLFLSTNKENANEVITASCYDLNRLIKNISNQFNFNFDKEKDEYIEEVKKSLDDKIRNITLSNRSNSKSEFSYILTKRNADCKICDDFTIEEIVKFIYSLTFYQKKLYNPASCNFNKKEKIRDILLKFLIPNIYDMVERDLYKLVLHMNKLKKSKDNEKNYNNYNSHISKRDSPNWGSPICSKDLIYNSKKKNELVNIYDENYILKYLSHLINIYYEHKFIDLQIFFLTIVVLSKFKNIDLVILSNILNICSKSNYFYDTFFVSFYIFSCFDGNKWNSILRDETTNTIRIGSIWKRFLKNIKTRVSNEKELNKIYPVNIIKIMNGLIYYKCLDKKMIEIIIKMISQNDLSSNENVAMDSTTTQLKAANEKDKFNLICLSSVLNYMSYTENIQSYDMKVKLVKIIKEKILRNNIKDNNRLLCSIYISYGRLNIYDKSLFYNIYKKLDIKKLSLLNILSILSYLNKMGIYDGKILRTCFNYTFEKNKNKIILYNTSLMIHLFFILTSICQLYLYDNIHTVLTHILYIINCIYMNSQQNAHKQNKKKLKQNEIPQLPNFNNDNNSLPMNYHFYSMLYISLQSFYLFFLNEKFSSNTSFINQINIKYLRIINYLIDQKYDQYYSIKPTNSDIQKKVMALLKHTLKNKNVQIVYEYYLTPIPYLIDMVILPK
ncbi:conserved Plasmodium protein, unknown function [Plasmodium chabaudi chabaudi]|uniref:Uncharacterized protein n=1 Tax=Plasmodium chabaudi chabaudi TaxID=31271 RepID=A0A1D3LBK8_PLACU|nr:conserved Plasmodium protein, unknown function [Plasmodium chabaudi chabaudi]